jgi:hypothetical protein
VDAQRFSLLGDDSRQSTVDDSRFFALLGSAPQPQPQELNTIRPEAKLLCWKLHARNPNRFFITLLLSRHSIREWQSFQLFVRFLR